MRDLYRFYNDDPERDRSPSGCDFYNDYFFSRDLGGVGEYYRDVTKSGFQFSDGTTVAP